MMHCIGRERDAKIKASKIAAMTLVPYVNFIA